MELNWFFASWNFYWSCPKLKPALKSLIFHSGVNEFWIRWNWTKHSKNALTTRKLNVNATLNVSILTTVHIWQQHDIRRSQLHGAFDIVVYFCALAIVLMFILFIRLWYECKTRVFYLFCTLTEFDWKLLRAKALTIPNYWHQNAVELANMVSIVWENRSGRCSNKDWNNSKSHSFSTEAF